MTASQPISTNHQFTVSPNQLIPKTTQTITKVTNTLAQHIVEGSDESA